MVEWARSRQCVDANHKALPGNPTQCHSQQPFLSVQLLGVGPNTSFYGVVNVPRFSLLDRFVQGQQQAFGLGFLSGLEALVTMANKNG